MFSNPPSRAQVSDSQAPTTEMAKAHSLTQLSTGSQQKEADMPQSGTPMSDLIIDVFKKLGGQAAGQIKKPAEGPANKGEAKPSA